VTAACFAKSGYEVACPDIDEQPAARRRRDAHPRAARKAGRRPERLTFTSSAAELFARADIAFVCVDTPPVPGRRRSESRRSVLAAVPAGTPDAA
jgi:UDPglucose 6-dehydrogenase